MISASNPSKYNKYHKMTYNQTTPITTDIPMYVFNTPLKPEIFCSRFSELNTHPNEIKTNIGKDGKLTIDLKKR